MIVEYLFCRSCGQLSPIDFEPDPSPPSAEPSDLDLFRADHAAHGLEVALRTAAPAVFDRPLWDPMSEAWFEVQVGSERFTVRSTRTSINQSRRWERTAAVIEPCTAAVELDEDYLRLALDRWFYPHVLSPQISDRFVEVLEDVAQTIDPDELGTAYDDSDDPQVSIAALPISARECVLERTQAFLDEFERQRLAGFVDAHCGADGALALHIRRPYIVRPR